MSLDNQDKFTINIKAKAESQLKDFEPEAQENDYLTVKRKGKFKRQNIQNNILN